MKPDSRFVLFSWLLLAALSAVAIAGPNPRPRAKANPNPNPNAKPQNNEEYDYEAYDYDEYYNAVTDSSGNGVKGESPYEFNMQLDLQ
jgi:hypothetical protein